MLQDSTALWSYHIYALQSNICVYGVMLILKDYNKIYDAYFFNNHAGLPWLVCVLFTYLIT